MSRVVDERVAEMRFDNKDFEANVAESLSTLDKLKRALNFGDAGKSFESISSAASNVNIGGIGEAIDEVSSKFSALEVAGVTALMNITNRAVDAGLAMVKSLTIDQITAGFDKYADKTTAVQTIMAATRQDFEDEAEQMEYVNDQLDKLNFFTDETSYNFVDMVSNIGKFTSAGVNLDEAVTSMQGIATWAAMSGANAQQASHAMYNLAQAAGQGYIQLVDWRSIMLANMSTIEFKEMAIQAGLALGTLKEVNGEVKTVDTGLANKFSGFTVTAENMQSTLSDAWFTMDVLNKVLNEYGGFANKIYDVYEETGLEVIGILKYTDEYAEGILDLAQLENETGVEAERLAEIFKELNDPMYELGRKAYETAQETKTFAEAIAYTKDAVSSGWMNTFEIIFGDYAEAKEMWSGLTEVFYELFVKSGEVRNAILGVWKELGGRTSMLQAVSNAWEALVKVFDTIKDAFRAVFPAKSVEEKGQALFNLTERVREFTEKLILTEESAEKLRKKIEPFFKVLKRTLDGLKSVGAYLKEYVLPVFSGMFNSAKKLAGPLGEIFTTIKDLFSYSLSGVKAFGFFDTIAGNIGEGLKTISQEFDGIIDKTVIWLNDFNQTLQTSETVKQIFGTIKDLLIDLAAGITNFLNLPAIIQTFKDSGGGIAGILAVIWRQLLSIWNAASSIFYTLTGINVNGILIGWSNKIKDIVANSEKLSKVVSVLKDVKDDLVLGGKNLFNFSEIMKTFNQNGGGFAGVLAVIKRELSIVWTTFKDIVKDITGIDLSETIIPQIAEKISQAFAKIKQAFTDFKNTDTSGVDNVIENVEEKLSPLATFLDKIKRAMLWAWDQIQKLGPKITAAVDKLGGSLTWIKDKIMSVTGKDVFNAAVLGGAVSGIIMLVGKAINLFWTLRGKIKDINVLKSIGGGIRELIENVSFSFDELQNSLKANVLLKIAAAITLITLSVAKLSDIDPVKLGVALGAITYEFSKLMTTLSATVKMSNLFEASKLKTIGLAMIELSVAILLLSTAVKKLSKLKFWDMIQGLVGVGALLAGLSLFINFTKLDNVSAKDLFGVIFIAEAINILATAVKKIGKLKLADVVEGVVSVGVLIGALGLFISKSNFSSFSKMGVKDFVGIFILAESINILASAVKKIGKQELGDVLEGVGSVIALLTAIGVFLSFTKESKLNLSDYAGLILVALSINILANVIAKLSGFNLPQIALGLAAIGMMLVEIGAFIAIIEATKTSSIKVLALAFAMARFANAVKILADFAQEVYFIDWKVLGKGAVVMAGGLLILVGAAALMSKAIVGVAGILLMTFALKQLLPVVKMFSSMGWEEIGKSLVELAGILVIIGLAGLLLGPISPMIVALGVALAALGKGLLAISIAMTLFSVAFTLMSTIGSAGVLALAGTLKVLLLGFIKFVGEAAMEIAKTIILLIKAFLVQFREIIPYFVETVGVIIDEVLKVIVKYGPSIVNSIGTLIIMLLQFVKKNLPILITLFVDTMLGILYAILDKIPEFVQAGIDIIIALIDGLGEGLVTNAPRLRESLLNFANNLLGAILSFFGIDKLVDSPSSKFTDIGKSLIDGLIGGIKKKIDEAVESVKELGEKVIGKVKGIFGINSPSKVFEGLGLNLTEGFSLGIGDGEGGVLNTIKSFASNIIGTTDDELGKSKFDLGSLIGFSTDSLTLPDASSLTDSLDLSSLTNSEDLLAGFTDSLGSIEGMDVTPTFDDADLLSDFGNVVGEIEDTPITPTVTPVLDLADFTAWLHGTQDDYQLSANLGISEATQSNVNGLVEIQNEIKTLNRDVTDYLARFREDFTYLINNTNKLKVIMDTGALVGSLVGPMDDALGERAMLAGRGV